MNSCKNCDNQFKGDYCSSCGFPNKIRRIDKRYVVSEISSVINFDKGIFYTVKELLIRPGDAVREFILENRRRLVKPILFLIICSVIYNISQQFMSFEAGYFTFSENEQDDVVIRGMYRWFSENYGYTNILMAILVAFWTKILFKKHHYNYYEIYSLLCFVMGVSILFYTFLGIIESVINYPIIKFGLIISLIYCPWAIGQFFGRDRKLNYLKGFLSYIFGMLSSLMIFIIIAIAINEII